MNWTATVCLWRLRILEWPRFIVGPLSVLLFGFSTAILPGATLTTIFSATNLNDVAWPITPLVQGSDGNFYGTSNPQSLEFVIYKITPGGVLTRLRCTMWLPEGLPFASLIQGSDGNFYGTTSSGVFKITSIGVYTLLYLFTNGVNVVNSKAALVQGNDGYFYGTSSSCGAEGFGTVFRISSNGGFTPLYSFANGADGANPCACLVQGNDGYFYGTTPSGGTEGFGTVFRISSSGGFTPLYSFTNGVDGANPAAGLIQGSDGNFYGTTRSGGTNAFGPRQQNLWVDSLGSGSLPNV